MPREKHVIENAAAIPAFLHFSDKLMRRDFYPDPNKGLWFRLFSLYGPIDEGTAHTVPSFFHSVPGPDFLTHGDRRRLFHIGLTQELRRFFGRRGIDVETSSPLEARSLG